MSEQKNLIDGLNEELERAYHLRELYKKIPTGGFGLAVINKAIDEAKKAMGSGDTVAMIEAYKELQSLE